ncbi:hypothetical protein SPRG_15554 [Saprolegnia parasitica CBS 223.65]|uniref:Uncharacterized protein n=1 Tax=Saprolegnia parasitica (strain CBS 223.65) TaxID=695850 RepID=A0A067BGY7_SAPPC|nr:hypothetical protein SPRG_15554 [Saprolegnia parasitica CBS 223.65]KDO17654.1 hypothetical protein SPRG_15554 [Saprolegnia parasitica CBS 223.65]|eukprot:XP_012211639.1 hypothetical protein SPRG_15554 [Saprolegnia parasitica CBS 223.65]
MDGENLDSRVIFRYLTVQKIVENYGAVMRADFTVLVEMVAASDGLDAREETASDG